MLGKYEVAHLLGVTRGNMHRFRLVEEKLTKQGYICFAPVIYQFDVYLKYDKMLDEMCYEKLKISDLCVIVTPEHIGKSTSLRIKQAYDLKIPVYTFQNDKLVPFTSFEDRCSLYPNSLYQNVENRDTTSMIPDQFIQMSLFPSEDCKDQMVLFSEMRKEQQRGVTIETSKSLKLNAEKLNYEKPSCLDNYNNFLDNTGKAINKEESKEN